MKIKKIIYLFCNALVLIGCIACSKDKGINPELAYKDFALFDSCVNQSAFVYYKNNPDIIYQGNNGPHGAFKLKFNKKANLVLTDNGKLPIGTKFPDGSMIVKEVMSGGVLNLYAIMYKYKNSWLWAEFQPDSKVLFSVDKDPSVCINCHQQSGNRDLVDSFIFY